jgi:hypothetical protein
MLTDGGKYDTKKFIELFKPTCMQIDPVVRDGQVISMVPITAMELSNTLQRIKEINKNVIIINNFEDHNCIKEWTDTATCDPSGFLLQRSAISRQNGWCDPTEKKLSATKCPVDCIKKWTDTTTCDPSGFLLQSSEITKQALNDGACDPTTSRIGATKCPVDCIKEWTDTTTCHPSGFLLQSARVTQSGLNGGTLCDTDTSRVGTTTCPVPCDAIIWINTSTCDSNGQLTQVFPYAVGTTPCAYTPGTTRIVGDFTCIKNIYITTLQVMNSRMSTASFGLNKVEQACQYGYDIIPIVNDIINNINLSLNLLYENIPVFDLSENSRLYTYFNKINTSLIMLTDGGRYDTTHFIDWYVKPNCLQTDATIRAETYITLMPKEAMKLSNTLQRIKEINKNVIIINNFEDHNCVKKWADTTTCDSSGYLLQSAVVTQERQFCDIDATFRVGTTAC